MTTLHKSTSRNELTAKCPSWALMELGEIKAAMLTPYFSSTIHWSWQLSKLGQVVNGGCSGDTKRAEERPFLMVKSILIEECLPSGSTSKDELLR